MEKSKSIAKKTPTETATGKVPKAPKAEKTTLPPHVPVETRMLTNAKMIIARREVIAAATKELDTWREEVAVFM